MLIVIAKWGHILGKNYISDQQQCFLARVIWQYIGDETLHQIASSVQPHEKHTYD